MHHHLAARTCTAGLDEAQVARRDGSAARERLLAQIVAKPPRPQQLADARPTRRNRMRRVRRGGHTENLDPGTTGHHYPMGKGPRQRPCRIGSTSAPNQRTGSAEATSSSEYV